MIQRANMDGTGQKALITSDIVWPNSLTIDMETYTVYWADAKPDFTGIYSMDYNGKNRRTVFRHENLRHPFSLTIFRNRLYWTDWKVPQINSCTKNNGSFHTVRDNINSPMGLVVISSERQPRGKYVIQYTTSTNRALGVLAEIWGESRRPLSQPGSI